MKGRSYEFHSEGEGKSFSVRFTRGRGPSCFRTHGMSAPPACLLARAPGIATSSAASACAIGRRDGGLTRDEALAHAQLIVDATNLPVTADLEWAYGDAPEAVAETIRLAAEVGLVGCSIEDETGNPGPSTLRSCLGSGTDCCGSAGSAVTAVFLCSDYSSAQSPLRWLEAGQNYPTAFEPSKMLERMCFSPPACLTSPPCAQFAPRSRSR